MRVNVSFDFSDDERRDLTRYFRKSFGSKGLPTLATRALCRKFINEAITNQWISVADELSGEVQP